MNNPVLEQALAALRAADDDIREHLQVCNYNLHGKLNSGERIQPPNPPQTVHQAGIDASQRVREQVWLAIIAVRKELEKDTHVTAPPQGPLSVEPGIVHDVDGTLWFNNRQVGTVHYDATEALSRYFTDLYAEIKARFAAANKLRASAGHLGFCSSDDPSVIRQAEKACKEWDEIVQVNRLPTT